MFTGIVEELGRFVSATPAGTTMRLEIAADLVTEDLGIGDSIAVNGCCLTVIENGVTSFAVEAVEETLSRTNLGQLDRGEAVNLERSLTLGGRLGGHIVQGHVDGVGYIVDAAPHLRIEVPSRLGRYLVEKGAVAIDGCSLTLVTAEPDQIRIEIIPHTCTTTTLGQKRSGAPVNVEVDVVAKYVEHFVCADIASHDAAPLAGGS